MATPNKQQIIEAATKAYMEENWEISDNLPETDELVESGHFHKAKLQSPLFDYPSSAFTS